MQSKYEVRSRREMLRCAGTLVVSSLAVPMVAEASAAAAAASEVDSLLEGSPIQLNEASIQLLKREAASVGETVARLRKIRLKNGDEPATVLRA